jgi:hypothetical protein
MHAELLHWCALLLCGVAARHTTHVLFIFANNRDMSKTLPALKTVICAAAFLPAKSVPEASIWFVAAVLLAAAVRSS